MTKDPALPTGVAELLAQSGYAAVSLEENAGFARVDARITWLEVSIKTALTQLTNSIVPVLAEMREEATAHRLQLATHQALLTEHSNKLAKLETNHTGHAQEITGVFQRLVFVEQAIVKRTPVKRRKKRIRK